MKGSSVTTVDWLVPVKPPSSVKNNRTSSSLYGTNDVASNTGAIWGASAAVLPEMNSMPGPSKFTPIVLSLKFSSPIRRVESTGKIRTFELTGLASNNWFSVAGIICAC